MQSQYPEVVATVTCIDGVTRKFGTLNDLFRYENPLRSAIKSIEIAGAAESDYRRGQVFLGTKYSSLITLTLEGREPDITELRTKVIDVIDGMVPWYSHAAIASGFNIFMFAMLAATAGSFFAANELNSIGNTLNTSVFVFACGYFSLWLFAAWVIYRARMVLFPTTAFGIGQGKNRYQKSEQWRWVVIVPTGLGVIGSLLATFLNY